MASPSAEAAGAGWSQSPSFRGGTWGGRLAASPIPLGTAEDPPPGPDMEYNHNCGLGTYSCEKGLVNSISLAPHKCLMQVVGAGILIWGMAEWEPQGSE